MIRNQNRNTNRHQGDHVIGPNQMIKSKNRHVTDGVQILEIITIHRENRRNRKRTDRVIENDRGHVNEDHGREIGMIAIVTIALTATVEMIVIVITEQNENDDRHLIPNGEEDHVTEQDREIEKWLQDHQVEIEDREVDRKRNQKSREKSRNILIITMNSKIFIKRKLKGTLFYILLYYIM